MIIQTNKIIEVIEELERLSGKDMEDLKFKILNAMINYEKEPEKLMDNKSLSHSKFKIKVNNVPVDKPIAHIKYNKKNKTFEFLFVDGTKKLEKFKEITIDLNLTVKEIFEFFNL